MRGVFTTLPSTEPNSTIMEWGRLAKCDFLALTETHTTDQDNPLANPVFTRKYSVAYANAPTKAAGVALIALNQRLKVVPIATGLAGRLLVAQVVDQESQDSIKVGVLYAMDSGKGDAAMERFFNQCWPLLPVDLDLLLGDFNVALRQEDASHSKYARPRRALAALLEHLSLADIAPEGASHLSSLSWR